VSAGTAGRDGGGGEPALFILAAVAAGTTGSVALGIALGALLPPFGIEVFDPGQPASQCVSIGFITTACLVLFRTGRPRVAVLIALMLPAFFAASAWPRGTGAAVASAAAGGALGGALVCLAAAFDALADAGYRFGKFLVAGPLVGGAYLAITPLAALGEPHGGRLIASMVFNTLLGIVIGDGAALGVEAAEAAFGPGRGPGPRDGSALPPGPPPVVE